MANLIMRIDGSVTFHFPNRHVVEIGLMQNCKWLQVGGDKPHECTIAVRGPVTKWEMGKVLEWLEEQVYPALKHPERGEVNE